MAKKKSKKPATSSLEEVARLLETRATSSAAKALKDLKAFEKTGCEILLYEGDVADENFNVGTAVIVVNGNLSISGNLADCQKADTSLLIVLGDVSCTNLLNLSAMHISGNLTVGNVLVGDSLYDYALRVGGNLTVPTILEYGHSIEVAGKIKAKDIYSVHTVKDHAGTRKSNLKESAMVDSIVKPRGSELIPDLSQTLHYIRAGGTVFRKP